MPGIYVPRPLRRPSACQVRGLRIKPYHLGGPQPAEARVERMVAGTRAQGKSEELGFAILDEGQGGPCRLPRWWGHGDILCGLSSLEAGEGVAPVDHHNLAACVRELPVIGHEQDNWEPHVMGGTPAPGAYLPEGPV